MRPSRPDQGISNRQSVQEHVLQGDLPLNAQFRIHQCFIVLSIFSLPFSWEAQTLWAIWTHIQKERNRRGNDMWKKWMETQGGKSCGHEPLILNLDAKEHFQVNRHEKINVFIQISGMVDDLGQIVSRSAALSSVSTLHAVTKHDFCMELTRHCVA